MIGVVFTDTSYFQRYIDMTYPHRWASCRICDGLFRDPKWSGNLAVMKRLAEAGKMIGYTGYCVFRPGVNVAAIVKAEVGKPDPYITIMLDVESWGGAIRGNHSAQITALATELADWLQDKRRVWVYGNSSDLASIFPDRPSWLKVVVADYSSVAPQHSGLIGWQYSDGTSRWSRPRIGGRLAPRSSKPFGPCDHNVFPNVLPQDLPVLFGLGYQPQPDLLEDIVSLPGAPKNLTYDQLVSDIANAVWEHTLEHNGNKYAAGDWLTSAREHARTAAITITDKTGGLLKRIAAVQKKLGA